jgi:lysophospholipase II
MQVQNDPPKRGDRTFGRVQVREPEAPHTHTALLFHGRGSDGEEFEEEFLDTKLSDGKTLAQKLPSWRWVFPSSKELWSTAFEEEMPAWFEAHSLTDITARQDLQMPGIRESVEYLNVILRREIEMLGGASEKVVIGGISQGGAIGLWTFLCQGHLERRLGGFVGASTWLPFASNVEALFVQDAQSGRSDMSAQFQGGSDADEFVIGMMGKLREGLASRQDTSSLLATPVFLGHGTDDAYVDITLGRQARDLLLRLGMTVKSKEYLGADQEGHWLKEPEELDDVAEFLASVP